jgi:hypothetical protein
LATTFVPHSQISFLAPPFHPIHQPPSTTREKGSKWLEQRPPAGSQEEKKEDLNAGLHQLT